MMERAHLQQIIGEKGRAEVQCKQALEDGAPFEIWEEEVSTKKLQLIYTRRERRSRRTEQDSVGFSDAVNSLLTYQHDSLRLGFVDDRGTGGYYFQIFLSNDGEQLVACLGVRKGSEVHET